MVEITSRAADSFCAAYFFRENATPQKISIFEDFAFRAQERTRQIKQFRKKLQK